MSGTVYPPPKEPEALFNASNWNDPSTGSLSQEEADQRYLIKVVPDTAQSFETFGGGISTNLITALNGNMQIGNIGSTVFFVGNTLIANVQTLDVTDAQILVNKNGVTPLDAGLQVESGGNIVSSLLNNAQADWVLSSANNRMYLDSIGEKTANATVTFINPITVDDSSGSLSKMEASFICVEKGMDRGGMKLTPSTDFCFGTFNNLPLHLKTNNTTRATFDGANGDFDVGNIQIVGRANILGSANIRSLQTFGNTTIGNNTADLHTVQGSMNVSGVITAGTGNSVFSGNVETGTLFFNAMQSTGTSFNMRVNTGANTTRTILSVASTGVVLGKPSTTGTITIGSLNAGDTGAVDTRVANVVMSSAQTTGFLVANLGAVDQTSNLIINHANVNRAVDVRINDVTKARIDNTQTFLSTALQSTGSYTCEGAVVVDGVFTRVSSNPLTLNSNQANGNIRMVAGNSTVINVFNGWANITGNLTASSNVITPINSSYWIGSNSSDNQTQKLRLHHAGNNGAFIDWNESVTNNSKITFRYGGVSPTGVFVMDGSGRMGINTTVANQNLTVVGNASISSTLNVTSNVVAGNIGVVGVLTMNGNATVGNLSVSSSGSMGSLTVIGNANIGNIRTNGDIVLPEGHSYWIGSNNTDNQPNKLRLLLAGGGGSYMDWNGVGTDAFFMRYGTSIPSVKFSFFGNTGSLGVNTTSAPQTLTVNGNASVSSTLAVTGNLTASSNAIVGALATYTNQTPFKVQHGNTDGTTSSGTVTFPNAYTTTPTVIVTSLRNNTITATVYVTTANTTQFNWQCRNNANALAVTQTNWLAIGT